MKPGRYILLISLLLSALVHIISGCTIFVVTPGASEDGSMYVGHTNDGYGSGLVGPNPDEEFSKLVYIPQQNYSAGAVRRVSYDAKSGGDIAGEWTFGKISPNGSIPQVQQTYGYLGSAYGVMNEYGLICSEATDYARTNPVYDAEKRTMYSSELSNIALERCKTPQEAIDIVAHLIDTYGYYGFGETLIFANSSEAWVMEMCGTPDGTGGIWAAQKIKDGEVFAGANIFNIRAIDPHNPNQRVSANARVIAEKSGWIFLEDGFFHFSNTFSAGEFTHPYHSFGRIWSIYNRIAPSAKYPQNIKNWQSSPYPFSVLPDHRLNRTEIFHLFRDHYEGTGWDMTKGISSGPFGDPYRDRGMDDEEDGTLNERIVPGAWPYPVSAITCGYSYICESGKNWTEPIPGICWFGFAQPYETCYIPVFPTVTSLSPLFFQGNRSVYDRTYGYWPFSTVTNWARLRYDSIIPVIKDTQERIEKREIQDVLNVSEQSRDILRTSGMEAARSYLTSYAKQNAENVVMDWWNLSDDLVVRFSNGMVWDPETKAETLAGYPDWWYNISGYQYGPRVYDQTRLDQVSGLKYNNKTIEAASDTFPWRSEHLSTD